MKFELAPEPVDGYPVIFPVGRVDEENVVEIGRFIRETCDRYGTNGALVDLRHLRGALSAESVFIAIPAFAEAIGQRIRVAYINRPEPWNPADDQFSRDVVYNRGGQLEVFDSQEEALDWLRQV